MEKHIVSKKWLITYLIILLFLSFFNAIGIALIIYSSHANSSEALSIGIVTLVYMLPITGIILFWLNRRACWIWIEDGLLKWKGLFYGFSGEIRPVEVANIGSGGKNIYIFAKHPKNHMHYRKEIFELSNITANRLLLKSFCSCEIYPSELCDICKNIEVGQIETPEKYLDVLSHFKELISSGNYEMFDSDYSIDVVRDENGRWVDDFISHAIKCKKCGAVISCYCDTFHGKGSLKKAKVCILESLDPR